MKKKRKISGLPALLIAIPSVLILLAIGYFCLFSGVEEKQAPEETETAAEAETVSADTSAAVRVLTQEEKDALAQEKLAAQTGETSGSAGSREDTDESPYLYGISGEEKLQSGMAEALTGFLDEYYASQCSIGSFFKTLDQIHVPDMTDWFIEPEGMSAGIWQNALQYMCAAKTVNENDLSFTDCSYSLTIDSVSMDGEDFTVEFYESCEVYFAYLDGIKSVQKNLPCTAVLRKVADEEWKFVSYYREEDFYLAIDGFVNELTEVEDLQQLCLSALERYFSNYLKMMSDKDDYNSGYDKYISAANAYDRQAAGAYAERYCTARSDAYTDYSEMGGNSMNFASQVLYAGGIPMDLEGDDIWKYYGDLVDESGDAVGRSPSWISSYFFHSYARNNAGSGLVCTVGANCFAGEAGDIFQTGDDTDAYNHSSVVLGTYEVKGQVVEILLGSNSADRENWPMTATFTALISMIKIQGWAS